MATSRSKADAYVREMSKADVEIRERLGIDYKDVTLTLRVDIQDTIRYHSHEDED